MKNKISGDPDVLRHQTFSPGQGQHFWINSKRLSISEIRYRNVMSALNISV